MIQLSLHKELRAANGELHLDVNLEIKEGQLITIYGNSGAGKTSILRMIAGLMEPDDGKISVKGKDWIDSAKRIYLKPQERKIGFVFQDYALFPNMTVKENLLYALDNGQDKQIVNELIEIIELEDLQNRKPETLSGGQKQRVSLARTLVRKPDLLLLDEPLSALDVEMRSKLQDYILKVHNQYNLTTILISHDIGEVIKMSDKTYVIEDGKITKQGKPIEIFTSKQLSGKFQFTGEILQIEREDVVYVITILIGANIVQILADESEASTMKIGDKVIVASKAFNPVIRKIN